MMRTTLAAWMARAKAALQRQRVARTERRIRQAEEFLLREKELHLEQMTWLRAELRRLHEQRIAQAGEADQYASGALR